MGGRSRAAGAGALALVLAMGVAAGGAAGARVGAGERASAVLGAGAALGRGRSGSRVPTVPLNGVEGTVEMPMAGLGVWQYNSSQAEAALMTALSVGYNMVDTALGYGNQEGVGRALKRWFAAGKLRREDVFVTSKIPGGLTAADATAALERCLEQLGLDFVDLMLVHFPASWEGVGGAALRKEQWLAMEDFAKKGGARALGVSHYCPRHLDDVLSVATVPVALNQAQYHVGMGAADDDATDGIAYDRLMGVVYQSFSPLCGPCGTDELISGELVTSIGAKHGKSGAQVSLRWQIQQGIPVIPKSDKEAHLKANLDLFDWTLSPVEMHMLTVATSPPVSGTNSTPPTSGDCDVA